MINEQKIKSDLKDLLKQMASIEDKDDSYEKFSNGLAKIIKDAIKSADVKVEAGIPVSTTGSAAAQTGVTTNVGNGSLS